MRSLEIRTQRIFNNLIKQNQKLVAEFCSITVKDSVQCTESNVQRPESSVQSPASRAQRPESSVQVLLPESRISGMPNESVVNILRVDKINVKIRSLSFKRKKIFYVIHSWLKDHLKTLNSKAPK